MRSHTIIRIQVLRGRKQACMYECIRVCVICMRECVYMYAFYVCMHIWGAIQSYGHNHTVCMCTICIYIYIYINIYTYLGCWTRNADGQNLLSCIIYIYIYIYIYVHTHNHYIHTWPDTSTIQMAGIYGQKGTWSTFTQVAQVNCTHMYNIYIYIYTHMVYINRYVGYSKHNSDGRNVRAERYSEVHSPKWPK